MDAHRSRANRFLRCASVRQFGKRPLTRADNPLAQDIIAPYREEFRAILNHPPVQRGAEVIHIQGQDSIKMLFRCD